MYTCASYACIIHLSTMHACHVCLHCTCSFCIIYIYSIGIWHVIVLLYCVCTPVLFMHACIMYACIMLSCLEQNPAVKSVLSNTSSISVHQQVVHYWRVTKIFVCMMYHPFVYNAYLCDCIMYLYNVCLCNICLYLLRLYEVCLYNVFCSNNKCWISHVFMCSVPLCMYLPFMHVCASVRMHVCASVCIASACTHECICTNVHLYCTHAFMCICT